MARINFCHDLAGRIAQADDQIDTSLPHFEPDQLPARQEYPQPVGLRAGNLPLKAGARMPFRCRSLRAQMPRRQAGQKRRDGSVPDRRVCRGRHYTYTSTVLSERLFVTGVNGPSIVGSFHLGNLFSTATPAHEGSRISGRYAVRTKLPAGLPDVVEITVTVNGVTSPVALLPIAN